jgi:transaldolase
MHKYGESETTQIMMATVRHVTVWAGRTKYQVAWFLLNRLYKIQQNEIQQKKKIKADMTIVKLKQCNQRYKKDAIKIVLQNVTSQTAKVVTLLFH